MGRMKSLKQQIILIKHSVLKYQITYRDQLGKEIVLYQLNNKVMDKFLFLLAEKRIINDLLRNAEDFLLSK